MAAENLASSYLSTLNSLPIQQLTAGEGRMGFVQRITDSIAVTANGMGTVGSTYRLCRFPTAAKIKGLIVDLGNVDTGGAGVQLDINVAFSDSLLDGTQSIYTPSNGATETSCTCIPQTGATGGVTSITTYSNPNKLFGTITSGSNTVSYNNQRLFLGSYANWFAGGPNLPVWQFFGFTNSQGYAQDPGGFFDILLYLSHAATTPAAASINVSLDYVL